MPDYVPTGQEFTDAIATVNKLLEMNRGGLELTDIYNYDVQSIPTTPAIAIVFDRGRPYAKSLGRRCNAMEVDLSIFLYLEALELGTQTFEHIGRLSYLTNLFYMNPRLLGLCVSEGMEIKDARLVGRALNSGVYLTGQVDLSLLIRFCEKDNP